MDKENFAVFILSFGRPENVVTYNTLRKQGYTGKIYIVCSTDDDTVEEYRRIYGEQVIVFNKNDYKDKFDIADNFERDNVVVFARNANRDIAKSLGLEYFLQLDDDYNVFHFRFPYKGILKTGAIDNLDEIFSVFINFLKKVKTVASIAMAQGGDFIGGIDSGRFKNGAYIGRKRKLMNTFFNCTARPYSFYGRINEDVNCYVQNGKTGTIFLTHPTVSINQGTTQANTGGLSEFYLATGTYIKSFYTILFNPSCTKIIMMGNKDMRLHHSITWNNAVPVIIRQEHKKR